MFTVQRHPGVLASCCRPKCFIAYWSSVNESSMVKQTESAQSVQMFAETEEKCFSKKVLVIEGML